MLKHFKSAYVVLLALLFVSPAQASEDWLNKLFPWLSSLAGGIESQDGSKGEQDSSVSAPYFRVFSPASPIYTPSGPGNGGGDPSIPDPH